MKANRIEAALALVLTLAAAFGIYAATRQAGREVQKTTVLTSVTPVPSPTVIPTLVPGPKITIRETVGGRVRTRVVPGPTVTATATATVTVRPSPPCRKHCH